MLCDGVDEYMLREKYNSKVDIHYSSKKKLDSS